MVVYLMFVWTCVIRSALVIPALTFVLVFMFVPPSLVVGCSPRSTARANERTGASQRNRIDRQPPTVPQNRPFRPEPSSEPSSGPSTRREWTFRSRQYPVVDRGASAPGGLAN